MPTLASLLRHATAATGAIALVLASAAAVARPLQLATTAPIEQTGLLAKVLPRFKQASGVDVQVVRATAAQALAAARKGELDVLLLDEAQAEPDKAAAQSLSARPVPVMFSEFVLVGPKGDPAGAAGKDVRAALGKIDATKSLFISRGDLSVTHEAEQWLWQQAGAKARKGGSHRACNCGMGSALDIAATAFGYILADKATWQSFRTRGDLVALVEGDPKLALSYSLYPLHVARQFKGELTSAQKADLAARTRDTQKLVQWFTSAAGRAAVAAHLVHSQVFFFPPAAK